MQELAKRLPECAKCTTFARWAVHELHTRFGGSEASEGGLDIHSMQENVAYIFFFSLLPCLPSFSSRATEDIFMQSSRREGKKGKGLAGFNTSFSVSMRREEGRIQGTRWVLWLAMAPFSKGRVKRTRTNQRIPMGWGRRREGESRGPTVQERERVLGKIEGNGMEREEKRGGTKGESGTLFWL